MERDDKDKKNSNDKISQDENRLEPTPPPEKGPTSFTFDQATDREAQEKDEAFNRRFKTPQSRVDAQEHNALIDELIVVSDAHHDKKAKTYQDSVDYKLWSPEFAKHHNEKLLKMGGDKERDKNEIEKERESGLNRIENEQYKIVIVKPMKHLDGPDEMRLITYTASSQEEMEATEESLRAADMQQDLPEKTELSTTFDSATSPFSRNETGTSRGDIAVIADDGGKTL